jgi:hypothetical protein
MDGIIPEKGGLVVSTVITGNQNSTHDYQGEFMHGHGIKVKIF